MTSKLISDNFAETVSNLLKESNTSQVLDIFNDNKKRDQIQSNAWDLIPIVASYLTETCQHQNIKVFKCCQELIGVIVEQSQPEEVLLQFVEEVELAEDDVKLLALLDPLKAMLLRVSEKRLTSLGWCFAAVIHYLEKIEISEDLNLVGEERLLLDADDTVVRIANLYNNLLVFCDTFVRELTIVDRNDSLHERKQLIGKFLLDLIGKPLAFLEMNVYKNTKPRIRIIAEKLIELYFSLNLDPYMYLQLRDGDFGSDLIKPGNLSLGVFYYLIISEQVCAEHVPNIYNPVYILNNCINLINELLVQNSQFAIEKGVNLAEALLKSVDNLELSYLLLDSEYHIKFCKIISKIIVLNENEQVRKKSLQILHNYLWCFQHQGRYLIILNLIRNLDHSGLRGSIIVQYKEMLTKEIYTTGLKKLNKYYKKHKLFDLLDEFTDLQNREETDLVDMSDQIVSALNFLRYLILVDKNCETGIDCYMTTLEEGYFKYLKTGIAISKEHYQLKIKEVKEEQRTSSERGNSDCQVSVTVSGKNLIEMSREKKIKIMNLSLTTLDVIDCLLSRLMECMNCKENV